jgi:hypothetical protein
MKPMFLLEIDICGFINCKTFPVVPSTINENAKNAMFNVTAHFKNVNNRFYTNVYSYLETSGGKS